MKSIKDAKAHLQFVNHIARLKILDNNATKMQFCRSGKNNKIV